MRPRATSLALASLAALVIACAAEREDVMEVGAPPPLAGLDGSAYDAGGRVQLPKTAPKEETGLHNVYELSERIVSGSEPHGEAAFKHLQEMGIRTILSVDGKVPDAELARKYGMEYVHVPIQYRGVEEDEVMKITKTFREKEGPFYVHCFHGKHRGPAAAEIGRLALDGIPREEALAEMRQWCGTSKSYEGLYQTVAKAEIPGSAATRAFDWDFPAAHPFQGFRSGMIEISRAYDNLKYLSKHDWKPESDHPDADPVNESAKLAGAMQRCNELESIAQEPQDFQRWMSQGTEAATELRTLVERHARREATVAELNEAFERLSQSCSSCHDVYRND